MNTNISIYSEPHPTAPRKTLSSDGAVPFPLAHYVAATSHAGNKTLCIQDAPFPGPERWHSTQGKRPNPGSSASTARSPSHCTTSRVTGSIGKCWGSGHAQYSALGIAPGDLPETKHWGNLTWATSLGVTAQSLRSRRASVSVAQSSGVTCRPSSTVSE